MTDTDGFAPISASLRFEILRRDNHTCRYCGGRAPDVELHVDHVRPRALGGANDPTNLVTACKDCNVGKGSTPPDATTVDEVDAKALAYREALQRAAAQLRAETTEIDDVSARFEKWWDSWGVGEDPNRVRVWKAPNWRQTVLNYLERGLPEEDLLAHVEVAMKGPAILDNKWRYFCGVCRNRVDKIQALAMEMLATDATAEAAPRGWRCEICDGPSQGVFIAHNYDHRWHTLCQDCEAEWADGAGEWPYWIPVDTLATKAEVDHWTNHLAQKTWFDFADWSDVVQRHSNGLTATEPPPLELSPMWGPDGPI